MTQKKRYLQGIPLFILFSGMLFCESKRAVSQSIRLDNLKEQFSKDKRLRIHGGLAANTVFYQGNTPLRDPFLWVLSGNINATFYNQFTLPFTFNLNNLGGNYTYPTLPNRLSLHPSYKWITAHIGDVSMNFSPYTLGGHQFTGLGFDLAPPDIPIKVSLMYGRLLKACEYKPDERLSVAAYKRMGYGAKAVYEKENLMIGMNFLSAADDEKSLPVLPDSLDLTPHKNIAFAWELGYKLFENLNLTAEYGISRLKRDTRVSERFISYQALKSSITYQLKKNTFGVGYERIDPDYQSLGAYYFTNDLENMTLLYARPFLDNKLQLSTNAGLQHNLDKNKANNTRRFVGAFHLNFTPAEGLNALFNYSNFQSFTHIKSQFDPINDLTGYDYLDTLDFTQLSQNAGININWSFGNQEQKKQSLGFVFSYQETADKKGDQLREGGKSRFYNAAITHSLFLIPQNIQIISALNGGYNKLDTLKMLTYGPSIFVSTQWFQKKMLSGVGVSYNRSTQNSILINHILNLRWNTSWILAKKHNLGINLMQQIRSTRNQPGNHDFTATFSYGYSF